MEAIVLFFTKAVASAAVGHYSKRILEKIDKEVAAMIESGADPIEIAATIESKNLTNEFKSTYEESLAHIDVIPNEIDVSEGARGRLAAVQTVFGLGFVIAASLDAQVIFLALFWDLSTSQYSPIRLGFPP